MKENEVVPSTDILNIILANTVKEQDLASAKWSFDKLTEVYSNIYCSNKQ